MVKAPPVQMLFRLALQFKLEQREFEDVKIKGVWSIDAIRA